MLYLLGFVACFKSYADNQFRHNSITTKIFVKDTLSGELILEAT